MSSTKYRHMYSAPTPTKAEPVETSSKRKKVERAMTSPSPKRISVQRMFYKKKSLECREDLLTRHAKVGYDPLDRALKSAREELKGGKYSEQEYKDKVRGLLREHIECMAEVGTVFHHVFHGPKLGFAIVLARYGTEGREFVGVEETHEHCEIYPGPLKPTDELIAVNGRIILEPTKDRFQDLRAAIEAAPRPVKLTFVQGERRDEAFFEQEERRKMRKHDRSRKADDLFATWVRSSNHQALKATQLADQLGELLNLGQIDDASRNAQTCGDILASLRTLLDDEVAPFLPDDRDDKHCKHYYETEAYVRKKVQETAENAKRAQFQLQQFKLDRDSAAAAGFEQAALDAKNAALSKLREDRPGGADKDAQTAEHAARALAQLLAQYQQNPAPEVKQLGDELSSRAGAAAAAAVAARAAANECDQSDALINDAEAACNGAVKAQESMLNSQSSESKERFAAEARAYADDADAVAERSRRRLQTATTQEDDTSTATRDNAHRADSRVAAYAAQARAAADAAEEMLNASRDAQARKLKAEQCAVVAADARRRCLEADDAALEDRRACANEARRAADEAAALVLNDGDDDVRASAESADADARAAEIVVADSEAKARRQAEERRLAEAAALKEAEDKRLAEAAALKEAEDKRLAEAAALKEAEDQRLAEEAALKEAAAAAALLAAARDDEARRVVDKARSLEAEAQRQRSAGNVAGADEAASSCEALGLPEDASDEHAAAFDEARKNARRHARMADVESRAEAHAADAKAAREAAENGEDPDGNAEAASAAAEACSNLLNDELDPEATRKVEDAARRSRDDAKNAAEAAAVLGGGAEEILESALESASAPGGAALATAVAVAAPVVVSKGAPNDDRDADEGVAEQAARLRAEAARQLALTKAAAPHVAAMRRHAEAAREAAEACSRLAMPDGALEAEMRRTPSDADALSKGVGIAIVESAADAKKAKDLLDTHTEEGMSDKVEKAAENAAEARQKAVERDADAANAAAELARAYADGAVALSRRGGATDHGDEEGVARKAVLDAEMAEADAQVPSCTKQSPTETERQAALDAARAGEARRAAEESADVEEAIRHAQTARACADSVAVLSLGSTCANDEYTRRAVENHRATAESEAALAQAALDRKGFAKGGSLECDSLTEPERSLRVFAAGAAARDNPDVVAESAGLLNDAIECAKVAEDSSATTEARLAAAQDARLAALEAAALRAPNGALDAEPDAARRAKANANIDLTLETAERAERAAVEAADTPALMAASADLASLAGTSAEQVLDDDVRGGQAKIREAKQACAAADFARRVKVAVAEREGRDGMEAKIAHVRSDYAERAALQASMEALQTFEAEQEEFFEAQASVEARAAGYVRTAAAARAQADAQEALPIEARFNAAKTARQAAMDCAVLAAAKGPLDVELERDAEAGLDRAAADAKTRAVVDDIRRTMAEADMAEKAALKFADDAALLAQCRKDRNAAQAAEKEAKNPESPDEAVFAAAKRAKLAADFCQRSAVAVSAPGNQTAAFGLVAEARKAAERATRAAKHRKAPPAVFAYGGYPPSPTQVYTSSSSENVDPLISAKASSDVVKAGKVAGKVDKFAAASSDVVKAGKVAAKDDDDRAAGGEKSTATTAGPREDQLKEGYANFDHNTYFYKMKDAADGMFLRDSAEAHARNASKECRDTGEYVRKFKAEEAASGHQRRLSVGEVRMHALNNAAAAAKRARAQADAVARLVVVADARVVELEKNGASEDQINKAEATAVVVRQLAEAAERDAERAEAVFRTTSKLNSLKKGKSQRSSRTNDDLSAAKQALFAKEWIPEEDDDTKLFQPSNIPEPDRVEPPPTPEPPVYETAPLKTKEDDNTGLAPAVVCTARPTEPKKSKAPSEMTDDELFEASDACRETAEAAAEEAAASGISAEGSAISAERAATAAAEARRLSEEADVRVRSSSGLTTSMFSSSSGVVEQKRQLVADRLADNASVAAEAAEAAAEAAREKKHEQDPNFLLRRIELRAGRAKRARAVAEGAATRIDDDDDAPYTHHEAARVAATAADEAGKDCDLLETQRGRGPMLVQAKAIVDAARLDARFAAEAAARQSHARKIIAVADPDAPDDDDDTVQPAKTPSTPTTPTLVASPTADAVTRRIFEKCHEFALALDFCRAADPANVAEALRQIDVDVAGASLPLQSPKARPPKKRAVNVDITNPAQLQAGDDDLVTRLIFEKCHAFALALDANRKNQAAAVANMLARLDDDLKSRFARRI